MGLRAAHQPLSKMAGRRRLPDPSHTPPTKEEERLGYGFKCDGCGLLWAKRYQDERTHRCIPCARAWRRDDMMSRRKGLGGVPLEKSPPPHPFKSRLLKKEIDLNSAEARRLIGSNAGFRDEVDAYIEKLVADNARPTPPLHGVLPLLSRGGRPKTKPNVVVPEDEPIRGPSREAELVVDKIVRGIENVIDGEVVDEER